MLQGLICVSKTPANLDFKAPKSYDDYRVTALF